MSRFSYLIFRNYIVLLILLTIVPSLGVILYTGLEQERLATLEVKTEVLRLGRLTSANQEQIKVKIDNRIPDIMLSELSEFVSAMIDVIGIYLCLINSHSKEREGT